MGSNRLKAKPMDPRLRGDDDPSNTAGTMKPTAVWCLPLREQGSTRGDGVSTQG